MFFCEMFWFLIHQFFLKNFTHTFLKTFRIHSQILLSTILFFNGQFKHIFKTFWSLKFLINTVFNQQLASVWVIVMACVGGAYLFCPEHISVTTGCSIFKLCSNIVYAEQKCLSIVMAKYFKVILLRTSICFSNQYPIIPWGNNSPNSPCFYRNLITKCIFLL